MNVVFCDKRECVFCDVDGICNCVMHDGIPYCKSESIDTKNDAADGLREENAKLRELCKSMRCALADHEDKVYLTALDKTLIDAGFDLQKLGIEVSE